MTVQRRPVPLHPPVDSFVSLQAWIDRRLQNIASDLGDDETCQSIGIKGQDRLRAYRTTLLDVAFAIKDAVEAEVADEVADAEYDRWKEAYGDDADKLAAYQAEGR